MREILFRGKRFDEDEWIYGSLLENDVVVTKGATEVDDDYIGFSDDWSSVLPETVGQYTGLTDKYGKRIFEWDIVEGGNFNDEDGYGVIEWDDDGARFIINGAGIIVDFDNYYGYELEIIGNIYDNPELLEEGDE